MLTSCLAWRVVLASLAERRLPLTFCATCGVNPSTRDVREQLEQQVVVEPLAEGAFGIAVLPVSIRVVVDTVLAELDPVFDEMYATGGRGRVPPDMLLKATVLTAMYTIRSRLRPVPSFGRGSAKMVS
jgi:hypothetical protein